jgi:hypothetical protein
MAFQKIAGPAFYVIKGAAGGFTVNNSFMVGGILLGGMALIYPPSYSFLGMTMDTIN